MPYTSTTGTDADWVVKLIDVFPDEMFERNPQTFVDIYTAKEYDFRRATHSVWHSRGFPSHITVRALSERERYRHLA